MRRIVLAILASCPHCPLNEMPDAVQPNPEDQEDLESAIRALIRQTSFPADLVPRNSRECLTKHIIPPVYYSSEEKQTQQRQFDEEAESAVLEPKSVKSSKKRKLESGSASPQAKGPPQTGKTPSAGTRSPYTNSTRAFYAVLGEKVVYVHRLLCIPLAD